MYCVKCGRQLQDEANYCAYCGTKVYRSKPAENPVEIPQVQETSEQHAQEAFAQQTADATEQLPQTMMPKAPTANTPYESSMSLAALLCGILAICLFWIIVPGIALGLAALVFGVRSTVKYPDVPKGQAVAGFILGITAIALSAFMILQFCGNAGVLPELTSNLSSL